LRRWLSIVRHSHADDDRAALRESSLFKDRNFLTGNVFIFIVGPCVRYAGAMPPLLQDLLNYPVVTTGLVTAPRGVGTWAAMFIVGRMMGKVTSA